MMKSGKFNSNLMKFKQKGAQLSELPINDHRLRYSALRDGKQLCPQLNVNAASKNSIKMLTSPKASILQIKALVEQKLKIEADKQTLFLNGKNVTANCFVIVQAGSIIHILDTSILCAQSDQVSVKLHVMNFLVEKQKQFKAKYTVAADEKVGQFLRKVKRQVQSASSNRDNNWQYCLLQSSRILDLEKSFFEQNISKTVQIICMITDNPLKNKYINDCDLSNEYKAPAIKLNRQSCNEANKDTFQKTRQAENEFRQVKIQRSLTGESPTFSSSMPNFKKKNRNEEQLNLPSRPLAKKIKSLKPRYEIEQDLQSEPCYNYLFEQLGRKECQSKQPDMQIPKSSPAIPELTPVNQRRNIKLEIQKLFNQSQIAKFSFNSKGPLNEMPFLSKQKADNRNNKKLQYAL